MKKIISKFSFLIVILLLFVSLIRVDARCNIIINSDIVPPIVIIINSVIIVLFLIVIPLSVHIGRSNYKMNRGFFKQSPEKYFSNEIDGRYSHDGKNASGINFAYEDTQERVEKFEKSYLYSDLVFGKNYMYYDKIRAMEEKDKYRIREEEYLKNQMKIKEKEHKEEIEKIKKEYGQFDDDIEQNQEDKNS